MSDIAYQIQHLRLAELQFRLASAVRLAATMKSQPLDLPIEWSHGKHSVRYSQIALAQNDADYGAWRLHRSATFLMAVAMKDAIRAAAHDPKAATDVDVRSAYQISRLIRNAFPQTPPLTQFGLLTRIAAIECLLCGTLSSWTLQVCTTSVSIGVITVGRLLYCVSRNLCLRRFFRTQSHFPRSFRYRRRFTFSRAI